MKSKKKYQRKRASEDNFPQHFAAKQEPSSHNLQVQDKPHLPYEIILHIISFLFPHEGLTISNDPAHNVDVFTVRSLLKTNLKIKSEVLQTIFSQPLRIHITNGKRCRCSALENPSKLRRTPLGKAARLPFHRFSEILVHMSLDQFENTCPLEKSKLTKSPPQGIHEEQRNFNCASACIVRQCKALSHVIQNRQDVKEDPNRIGKMRFIFDKSKGVRETTLTGAWPWNICALNDIFSTWQWMRPHYCGQAPQVTLPNIASCRFLRRRFRDPLDLDGEDVLEHIAGIFQDSVMGLWEERLRVETIRIIDDWNIDYDIRLYGMWPWRPFVSYRIDIRYQGHAENLEPRFKASRM
ncbi:hypothetical protein LTR06_010232 [Exophiala xenobiotica]|nr:hypothetical protein LTR14_009001 [Exophiala xenobiotica]KAK5348857.1 hypothetical protein LTR61_007438 [Exophiala xenobiotica]KAK5403139.1 hypothetical protein LTR06_010232 [Exophiala xenobiotica]